MTRHIVADLRRLAPPLGRCRVCGAVDDQRPAGFESVFGVGQQLVRCGVCAVAYLDPAMTEDGLARFYNGPYHKLFLAGATNRCDARFLHAVRARPIADLRVSRLADAVPPHGRVLEIGAGYGAFLGRLHARRPDLRLFAVEPDRAHRAAALDGAPVTFLDDGNIAAAGPFDLVGMFHSLEHVADPARLIADVAAVLTADGRVAIEVPDALAPWSGWRDVHPAHLSYFTAPGLLRLLRRVGLRPAPEQNPPLAGTLWCEATPDPTAAGAEEPPAREAAAALDRRIAAHPPRPTDRLRRRIKATLTALLGAPALGTVIRLRNAPGIDRLLTAGEPSGRIHLFGVPVDPLTMEETVERARAAMADGRALRQSDVNVAKLVSMIDDPILWSDVAGSDIVNADGMGILLAARLLGAPLPGRVAGVDLMERLLALSAAEGFRPYILGARPEALALAAERLRAKYPGLRFAGLRDGYFTAAEEPEVVRAVRDSRADALFVAMPTPFKERFLARRHAELGTPFVMGVGGSIDVVAGLRRRAPMWMQRAGLEWLARMLQEPRRLGPRYLSANLRFALLLAGVALGRRNS